MHSTNVVSIRATRSLNFLLPIVKENAIPFNDNLAMLNNTTGSNSNVEGMIDHCRGGSRIFIKGSGSLYIGMEHVQAG